MSMIAIAAHYLVTLLNTIGDGYPDYPPNSWRIITITSTFLNSFQHLQETGKVIAKDHKVDKGVDSYGTRP